MRLFLDDSGLCQVGNKLTRTFATFENYYPRSKCVGSTREPVFWLLVMVVVVLIQAGLELAMCVRPATTSPSSCLNRQSAGNYRCPPCLASVPAPWLSEVIKSDCPCMHSHLPLHRILIFPIPINSLRIFDIKWFLLQFYLSFLGV